MSRAAHCGQTALNYQGYKMLNVKKVTIAAGQAAAATVTKLANNKGEPLFIGRLIGIATGVKEGASNYGEWVSLIGDFVKTAPDGEVTRAMQAFGPDMVILPVASALKGGAGVVNVAVDVYAVLDEKSPVGFSYRTDNVIAETEESPMQRLLALAQGKQLPALAAPAKKTK